MTRSQVLEAMRAGAVLHMEFEEGEMVFMTYSSLLDSHLSWQLAIAMLRARLRIVRAIAGRAAR